MNELFRSAGKLVMAADENLENQIDNGMVSQNDDENNSHIEESSYENNSQEIYDEAYQRGFHPSQELDHEDDQDQDDGYDPDNEDEDYEYDPEEQEGPIEHNPYEDDDYEPNQDNRPTWDAVVGNKESTIVKEIGKHCDVLTDVIDKDNNTRTVKFVEGLNEEQKKDALDAIEDIKSLVDTIKENAEDNQEHVEIEKSDSESVTIKFNYGKF